MRNRIIISLSLVLVLSVSIFFGINNLPAPENELISYRDSFEHHTNSSDVFVDESKTIVVSTEDLVEMHTFSEETPSTSNSSTQTENQLVPFSSSNSNCDYQFFFDGDDDMFDDNDELKEVYVSVTGIDETLAKGYITFESGDTVFDVTQELLNKNDIKIGKRGGGTSLYIYKIGDLEEKDHGPMSGWVYTVNGDRVNYGCGSYKVSDGDVIDWIYQQD